MYSKLLTLLLICLRVLIDELANFGQNGGDLSRIMSTKGMLVKVILCMLYYRGSVIAQQ